MKKTTHGKGSAIEGIGDRANNNELIHAQY